MTRRSIRAPLTIAALAVAALAAVAALLLPPALNHPRASVASAVPDVVHILGVVRDFRRAHADFDVVPPGGNGHYAGTVEPSIGPGERPVLAASGGFRVAAQWRDAGGRPIPAHLAIDGVTPPTGSAVVHVVTGPTIIDSGYADTFDSSVGPYGGSNIGPAPTFLPGSTMPTLSAPTGMPPRVDCIEYAGGTSTLSADRYVKDFIVKDGAVLRISGNVRILSDEKFVVQNAGRIELLAGATLALWVRKVCTFQDEAQVNVNTAQPGRFAIHNLGIDPVIFQNDADVYAAVTSPHGRLHVQDEGNFYGTFTGLTVHIQNNGGFHLDAQGGAPVPVMLCGAPVNDTPGSAGASGNGGVTSAATFDEWFRDVLGTNLSKPHRITLVNDGSGVYEYLDDEFFPIDSQLLGNEGDEHNYFFTYAFAADFVFSECAGQFLSFEGADAAWCFVDDALGLDIGGVVPGTVQHVAMDRLGLVGGQTYTLRFFYAQRNGTAAVFRLRTNLPLQSAPPAPVTGGYD
jgi:fibro-slime domain-containing protein